MTRHGRKKARICQKPLFLSVSLYKQKNIKTQLQRRHMVIKTLDKSPWHTKYKQQL